MYRIYNNTIQYNTAPTCCHYLFSGLLHTFPYRFTWTKFIYSYISHVIGYDVVQNDCSSLLHVLALWSLLTAGFCFLSICNQPTVILSFTVMYCGTVTDDCSRERGLGSVCTPAGRRVKSRSLPTWQGWWTHVMHAEYWWWKLLEDGHFEWMRNKNVDNITVNTLQLLIYERFRSFILTAAIWRSKD
jgi:hypothetical protein